MEQNSKKIAFLRLVGTKLKEQPLESEKSDPLKKKARVRGMPEALEESKEAEKMRLTRNHLEEMRKRLLEQFSKDDLRGYYPKFPVPEPSPPKNKTAYRLEQLERELDERKAAGQWDSLATRQLRKEILISKKKLELEKLKEEAEKLPEPPREEYRAPAHLLEFLANTKIPVKIPAMEAYEEYDPLRLTSPQIQSHSAEFVARRIVAPADMEAIKMLWEMAKENDALLEYQQELLSQLAKGAKEMPERLTPKAADLW